MRGICNSVNNKKNKLNNLMVDNNTKKHQEAQDNSPVQKQIRVVKGNKWIMTQESHEPLFSALFAAFQTS